jgi:hypothetical protein
MQTQAQTTLNAKLVHFAKQTSLREPVQPAASIDISAVIYGDPLCWDPGIQ